MLPEILCIKKPSEYYNISNKEEPNRFANRINDRKCPVIIGNVDREIKFAFFKNIETYIILFRPSEYRKTLMKV